MNDTSLSYIGIKRTGGIGQMEEKTTKKVHRVLLNNRRIGSFGGVLDVISFDVSAILLETEQGMLEIKGKDLHVNRLNLEQGEVDVEGQIDSLAYSEVKEYGKSSDSLLGRLFR